MYALLLTLSLMICVIPSFGNVENQFSSNNIVNKDLNESFKHENVLDNKCIKVKADYAVTTKQTIKVCYSKKRVKVKVKVAVKYKSRGKWKTKYKYKYVYQYVYKYYYKDIYTTRIIRDIPPGECTGPTVNCQSDDPRIKTLSNDLTSSTVNETVRNNESAPVAPTKPQTPKYNGSSDKNSQEYQDYINSPEYQQYLQQKQQYDQNYTDYQQKLSQYQEYITVSRNLTTLEKATNIFNWVRDNTEYSFYYNTQRGAVATLNDRLGNCVDLSHLIVALSRASGISARYMQADCAFKSGVMGHVWVQLYVDGKWIDADASNNINDFGIIRNWCSSTLKGIYSSLPF